MKRYLLTSAIALGLILTSLPAQAEDLTMACEPLRNFMLTSLGRCLNLDSLVNGGISTESLPPAAATTGQWKIGTAAIAYYGDQGLRRVTIPMTNNGTTRTSPFAISYRIVYEGEELYQGNILSIPALAPGETTELTHVVGPQSLRGTQIANLRVEVTKIIE